MTDVEDEVATGSYTSSSNERQSSPLNGKHHVEERNLPTEQKPALFQPGMLQELMSEVRNIKCTFC